MVNQELETLRQEDKALTEQLETDVEHTNIEVEFLLISLFKFWQEGLEQHNRH